MSFVIGALEKLPKGLKKCLEELEIDCSQSHNIYGRFVMQSPLNDLELRMERITWLVKNDWSEYKENNK